MLRTALKPKWLGLLVLAALVIVLFWQLGLWQLHVAQDKGSGESAVAANPSKAPVPVDTLLQTHESFPGRLSGRLVTMEGSYAGSRQVLVAGRRLDGVDGFWVVAALYGSGSSGGPAQTSVLPVLRGFVATQAEAPRPPTGELTVSGSLAPGESPSTMSDVSAGAVGSLDLSVLVNQWPGQIYNAFVFATAEKTTDGTPVATGEALHRIPPPNPTGGGGLAWRNAAYALQWWMFAVFAVWMWVKMVRDDWLTAEAARQARDDPTDNGSQYPAEEEADAP